jgi:hypothetical protein
MNDTVTPEQLQREANAARARAVIAMHEQSAWGDVAREIEHALSKGYNATHDDAHSVGELLRLVRNQLTRVYDGAQAGSLPAVRRFLVRTAATAIATIESIDRRLATEPASRLVSVRCSRACGDPRPMAFEHPGVCMCGGFLTDIVTGAEAGQ